MSYILEALKKAQAERQLGATPGVHAPTLDCHVAARRSRPQWMPPALGATAVVAVAALALLWRQQGAPHAAVHAGQAVPLAQAAELAQPVPSAPPARPAQQVPPVQTQQQPAQLTPANDVPAPTSRNQVAQLVPAVSAALPSVQASAAPRPGPLPAAQAAGAANAANEAGASPVKATVTAAVPPAASLATPSAAASKSRPAASAPVATASATPPAADNTDDVLPYARDLPEPIQRSIPTVAMGGYMYSRNPADRLLLVDKVLRHEGEEVAPGLVLDKLLPKAAVFSFRGYRYRVPL